MRYFPKVLKLAYKFTSTSADGLVSSFIGCFDGVEELKGVDDMIIFHLLGYILYSIMFYCDELKHLCSWHFMSIIHVWGFDNDAH